jgi:hypothetical protein
MSIETMKQALEAMEELHRTGDTQVFDLCFAPKVIPALRLAIEQAEKQEPGIVGDVVEWLCERCECIHPVQRQGLIQPCPHCKSAMKPTSFNLREIERLQAMHTAPPQQEKQEPVAWMVYTLDGTAAWVTLNPADFTSEHRALPLYTAPPQRQPLTEEEIAEIAWDWKSGGPIDFARAIERAHGIGGDHD